MTSRNLALTPPALHDARAEAIHRILPQTQCQRCGYPDCAGYAEAIATGTAGIDQCPPGGTEGMHRIAAVIALEPARVPATLNPEFGQEGPMTVAVIDEAWCIGCTLCIKACPTDAILGSNKRMHTVVEAFCTGCDLCAIACPVDCIAMEPISGERTGWNAWSPALAAQALQRYTFHQFQQQRAERDQAARLEAKAQHKLEHLQEQSLHTDPAVLDKKRAIIEAALAKARARRQD